MTRSLTRDWTSRTRSQNTTTRLSRRRFYYNSLFSFERQLCTFARMLSLLSRYFHYFFVKKTTMFTVWWRHAHSDWHWSICIGYRLVLCRHGHIYYPWHLRKPQFKTIPNKQTKEIPTNKGANSHKLNISKMGN